MVSPILITLVQGTAAFATTNVDDILLLALYFAQTNAALRRRHIVVGQYLGFAVIIGVSLLGLLGALVLPKAVTLANGADNVSIYVPLFAAQHPANIALIVGLFFGLVGVWCYAGYRIARQPAVGRVLSRYGARLIPYVLIALGASIVLGIG